MMLPPEVEEKGLEEGGWEEEEEDSKAPSLSRERESRMASRAAGARRR